MRQKRTKADIKNDDSLVDIGPDVLEKRCETEGSETEVKYKWHRLKAARNLKDPGVSFEEAQTVFEDPFSEERMENTFNLLPGNQEKALQALLAGKGVQGAAEAAGVRRQRISHWLHNDPGFVAAYRERRQRLAEQFTDGLLSLGEKVVACLARELEGENQFEAAKFLAKTLANLPSDFGKTLPAEVEAEIEMRGTRILLNDRRAFSSSRQLETTAIEQ